MHPADRVFMRRLMKRIIDEQNDRVGQLASGSAADHADYRNRCGYIQALEHVRLWCEEIAETEDEPRPNSP